MIKEYTHKLQLIDIENYIPKGQIVLGADIAINHSAFVIADVIKDKTIPLYYLTTEDLGYKTTKIAALDIHDKICVFVEALLEAIWIAQTIKTAGPFVLFEEINFQSAGQAAALGEAMLQGVIRSIIHQQHLMWDSMTPAQHYKANTGKSVHFTPYVDASGKKKKKSINKEVIMAYVEQSGYTIPTKNYRSVKTQKNEKNDDIADVLSLIDAYRKIRL